MKTRLAEPLPLSCHLITKPQLAKKRSSNGKTTELLEQIDKRLDELGDALERGESEQLVTFLTYLSRFHRYSFGNVLLIELQKPDATRVGGFQTWKKLGRHVKKGERGIAILAPVVRQSRKEEEKDDDGDGETKAEDKPKKAVGYRTVHIFDVSQTDGDPLPEFARVAGEPGQYIQLLRENIVAAGIDLQTEYIPGGAHGVSRGGEIAVRPELPDAETFAILTHEFAHELLHRGERRSETTKTIRETEAEAVAFVVSKTVGLETGTASSDYIKLYNGSREMLQESLKHIRRCAAEILDGLLQQEPSKSKPKTKRANV